jgi:hypothetical protein
VASEHIHALALHVRLYLVDSVELAPDLGFVPLAFFHAISKRGIDGREVLVDLRDIRDDYFDDFGLVVALLFDCDRSRVEVEVDEPRALDEALHVPVVEGHGAEASHNIVSLAALHDFVDFSLFLVAYGGEDGVALAAALEAIEGAIILLVELLCALDQLLITLGLLVVDRGERGLLRAQQIDERVLVGLVVELCLLVFDVAVFVQVEFDGIEPFGLFLRRDCPVADLVVRQNPWALPLLRFFFIIILHKPALNNFVSGEF